MVTDASGTILGTQRYYPFGETRLTTGTIYTDKLFTGQREMRRPEPVEGAGLGIYHYQARFYSSKLGRFLSADTIVPNYANPQGWNRFSYVTNNPLRYTDPTGHMQAEDRYTSNNGTCNVDDKSCNWVGKSENKPKKHKNDGRTVTSTSTPCSVVFEACSHPTSTSTPFPTSTSTPYYGPIITTPPPPTPYYDYDININWNKVDKLQAALDVAGIGADVALLLGPKIPGGIIEGVVTAVEVAAAGKTLYDAAGGDLRNLSSDTLIYSLEHNPVVVARAGRWVPIIGSIGSGFSLYSNFSDAVTITKTTKYR